MPQTSLLVFDLETVPDHEIIPPDRDPEAFPKPSSNADKNHGGGPFRL